MAKESKEAGDQESAEGGGAESLYSIWPVVASQENDSRMPDNSVFN